MEKIFRLGQREVQQLAEKYDTPLLVLSLDQVERNYRFLESALGRVKLYYAVKANPDRRLVNKVAELGGYFDVASDGEMTMLQEMGIAAERLVYANPIKTRRGLQVANATGVRKFTFDSAAEIDKMATAVPGGTVLLRVRVDNPKALVDLNIKFGANPDDALPLLRQAREQGLDVAGICFHVGSQSSDATAHINALKLSRRIFDAAAAEGMPLRLLDIGGGFPIPSLKEDIDVKAMTAEIREALDRLFPDTEIWAEPGRFICGTAVNLITRVIGMQRRNNTQWYFLDDGIYGTFSGVIFDHWDFELETFKDAAQVPATFAGPSCDSFDVIFRDKPLAPLTIGDLILVPACGAYTSASASEFNGFSKTPMIVWEEEIGTR